MMRSMYAGVSALRNHQLRMDVVGNNIANVNTLGFKSSRVTFQEVFSQTVLGASTPQAGRGGTNPQQIGLGVAVSTIDTLQSQGNLQPTGKITDLAIEGNGFFVLDDGRGNLVFTRAGRFDQDALGNFVTANGLMVMGWMATNGVFPTKDAANLGTIRIPVGETISARATALVEFAHNLDANTVLAGTYVRSVDVYDSLGNAHSLIIQFQKVGVNQWTWTATHAGGLPLAGNNGTIDFGPDGRVTLQTGGPVTFNPPGAAGMSVTLDFAMVTQYAAESTVQATSRDGYPMGALQGFTIDLTGTITGIYTNGLTQSIAQVALAHFSNPGGLLKKGENLYMESNNSGLAQIGEPDTGGRGNIAPGTLEMSNVDLSQEFTDMIVTQRGFQANSRVVTTSDEMLQELVNLKR